MTRTYISASIYTRRQYIGISEALNVYLSESRFVGYALDDAYWIINRFPLKARVCVTRISISETGLICLIRL